MACEITWGNKELNLKFSGKVIEDDLFDLIKFVQGNEKFDSLRYEIFDFPDVEEYQMSEKTLKIFVQINKASSITNPNLKMAIVIKDAGMVRMAELFIKEIGDSFRKVEWFSSVENEREWFLK